METVVEARRWFNLPAAAEYLGVGVRTIRELIWRGQLRRSKIGRRFIVDRLDMDALALELKRSEVQVSPKH
jgi:excisionase family DNA binding protein